MSSGSGSMSVHSLIDKFQSQPLPPSTSTHRQSSSTPTLPNPDSTRSERNIDIKQEESHQHQLHHRKRESISEMSQENLTSLYSSPTINQTGLLSLLGPNVTSFPFSESAYTETIKLRAEQERTKQDFYMLEIANRNLSIIQTALSASVPSDMIPSMCVGSGFNHISDFERQVQQQQQRFQQQSHLQPQQQTERFHQPQKFQQQPQKLQQQQSQQQPQSNLTVPGLIPIQQQQRQQHQQPHRPNPSAQTTFQPGHMRSSSSKDYTTDLLNANPIPPMQFKFGSGSGSDSGQVSGSRTPIISQNRRPLSPAKIGAAAVANLANPITPYKTQATRTLPLHQRHFSMPVETGSKQAIDLNKINTHLSTQQHPKHKQGSPLHHLHSPLGATSSIQVKPSPAQPLHKQAKLTQPPSQESMTSFQHIIQFHHWKPENPGQGVMSNNPSSSSGPNPFRNSGTPTHKRHKSNADITMNTPQPQSQHQQEPQQVGGPAIRISDSSQSAKSEDHGHDDIDITMDTSSTSITDIRSSARKTPREESRSGKNPAKKDIDNGESDSNLNPGQTEDSGNDDSSHRPKLSKFPHDILSPSNE